MDLAVAQALAIGALVPGFIAVVIFLPAWWARRGTPDAAAFDPSMVVAPRSGERLWVAPVVFGGIGAACFPALLGMRQFPPARAFEWMPWIAVASMVLGVLAPGGIGGGVPLRRATRWSLRAVLLLAVGYVSSRSLLTSWGPAVSVMWIGGFVLTSSLVFWGAESWQDRERGWSGPAVIAIWAGAASQVLIATLDSLKQGQVAVAIASIAGAATLVAVRRPRFTFAFGGVHVPVVLIAAALLQAAILKDNLPAVWWVEAALLVATMILPATIGGHSVRGRRVGKVLLAAVPALAASVLAIATMAAAGE